MLNGVRIRVRDYGPGVQEKLLTEIFKPFNRGGLKATGNGTHSAELDNAGLGLAITERVIRMHSGTIQAHNAMNGGLVIEITLPG